MRDDKGVKGCDKCRHYRYLLTAALCLSTLAMVLTLACGVAVMEMRKMSFENEAKLKRYENQIKLDRKNFKVEGNSMSSQIS